MTADQGRWVVTVLGDVVGSRSHDSRQALQHGVRSALEATNEEVASLQPLVSTIGDEFQGLYAGLAAALDATMHVRLRLLGTVDVRFGVGYGPLTVFEPARAPFGQDGPAWWAARTAVDRAREMSRRQESPRGVRTVFLDSRSLDPAERPRDDPMLPAQLEGLVEAFLLCRDELVAAMDERDAGTMLGLLADRPLSSIAEAEGVTLSAVSQRAIGGGLYALRLAHRRLRESLG